MSIPSVYLILFALLLPCLLDRPALAQTNDEPSAESAVARSDSFCENHSQSSISPSLNQSTASDFRLLEEQIAQAKNVLDMPSGVAIAVIEGDEVVYEGYFGCADVESELPVGRDTHFYIASTAKALVASAFLLVEHQGIIEESTTLDRLFPNTSFPRIDPTTITVRHLLTHTSGVDNLAFTWAASYTGQHDQQLRDRFVASLYPDSDVSTGEFEYTNLGYNVMSVWFETQYDQDWRVTLGDLILRPLGMHSTSGFISDVPLRGWEYARPYSYKHAGGQQKVYLEKDDRTMYSIGLLSTASDMAKFVRAHINDGVVDGTAVLPAAVFRKARTPQVAVESYYDGYAWGWQLRDYGNAEEVFHTGGFTGASTLISFIPEYDIGVVVLENEDGLKANTVADIVKNAAYRILLGDKPDELSAWIGGEANELADRANNAQAEAALTRGEKESLPWRLSASLDSYAGSYVHELAGTIRISRRGDDGLTAIWGNLQGQMFAHSDRDAAEAMFRPDSYLTIEFQHSGRRVDGLLVNGYRFVREESSE